jgi:hypothetical protein
MIELPNLGGVSAYAMAVSGDGSVVGHADSFAASASLASMWDVVHGTRSVTSVLTELGVNLNSWQLFEAMDISVDGVTIIGYRENHTAKLKPGSPRRRNRRQSYCRLSRLSALPHQFAVGRLVDRASTSTNGDVR